MPSKKANVALRRFPLRPESLRALCKKTWLWEQKCCLNLRGNHSHPSPPLTHQISLSGKSGHRSRVKAKKGNGRAKLLTSHIFRA